MLKRTILLVLKLALLSLASKAMAEQGQYFTSMTSKPLTKMEAVKAALTESKQVWRCSQVKLTDKLSFKNIKKDE